MLFSIESVLESKSSVDTQSLAAGISSLEQEMGIDIDLHVLPDHQPSEQAA